MIVATVVVLLLAVLSVARELPAAGDEEPEELRRAFDPVRQRMEMIDLLRSIDQRLEKLVEAQGQ